jgi:hypothetical protein
MELGDQTDQALDRFFTHYYKRRPVNATFTGVHEYDTRLPDWSPDGIEATVSEMIALREELTAVGTTPAKFATVDRALADAFLEIQIAELQGEHFQLGNPSLYTGEAIFGTLSLMLRDFAPAELRADAIESRLRAVPQFLVAAQRNLGSRPIPASWMARAATECDGAILALGNGLEKWCAEKDLQKDHVKPLTAAALPALAAFDEFRSWLETVTAAPARQSGCGPDFFDLLLRRGHWCGRSRQDLLEEAHECFAEAEARLGELARGVCPGDWPAVAAQIAERHPDLDHYLDSFGRCWDACRRVSVERDLVSWPDLPVNYTPIPLWAREAAPHLYFLNYRSPAPYDDLAGVDYLVPPIDADLDLEKRETLLRVTNNSVIKLNHVVHHGGFGHHVQNSYAYRSASRIGQVAGVDCASRIGMFCGGTMAEGWACYATDVMGEVGFLDALELVAEQHSRLRQLARAVVDIELHQHSMDEAGARRFYENRVGMSPSAAARETTRDSIFPGTAIMYWLGTQAIHDLRAERQRVEGSAFSLREFHDRLLSFGSVPVLCIGELMDEGNKA